MNWLSLWTPHFPLSQLHPATPYFLVVAGLRCYWFQMSKSNLFDRLTLCLLLWKWKKRIENLVLFISSFVWYESNGMLLSWWSCFLSMPVSNLCPAPGKKKRWWTWSFHWHMFCCQIYNAKLNMSYTTWFSPGILHLFPMILKIMYDKFWSTH